MLAQGCGGMPLVAIWGMGKEMNWGDAGRIFTERRCRHVVTLDVFNICKNLIARIHSI